MKDYEYTAPDINEESVQLLQEQTRVMAALVRGEYPPSHCFFIFYSEDKPKGYWGTERIPELLERFRQDIHNESSSLYIATLWNDNPDLSTTDISIDDEDSIPEPTMKVIREGTLMNLSDFIYGCCLTEEQVNDYLIEISTIILTPVEGTTELDFKLVFSSLKNIAHKLSATSRQH